MNKKNKYLYCFKRTNIVLIFALLATFKTNSAKANDYLNTSEDRYSYNLLTAQLWELSPYLYFGYTFNWVPYSSNVEGIDYKSMLKNGHNGIIGGLGVTINKNWSFGISYSRTHKKSKMRDSFVENYQEVNSINSDVNMFNIDIAMRLPFSLYQSKTNFYILGGMNIIYTTLNKNFYNSFQTIPFNLATNNNKTAFGANVGLGISYNIVGGFFIRFEGRRLFILTRNSSNIKDIWIFNAVAGINF